jgi:predicted nucleic acid-binding protein
MIRAVLDTNVLASGALGLTGGVTPPALLLQQWRAGRFRLIMSDYIEKELRKALAQPYFTHRIRSEDRELLLILLTKVAEQVAIRPPRHRCCDTSRRRSDPGYNTLSAC